MCFRQQVSTVAAALGVSRPEAPDLPRSSQNEIPPQEPQYILWGCSDCSWMVPRASLTPPQPPHLPSTLLSLWGTSGNLEAWFENPWTGPVPSLPTGRLKPPRGRDRPWSHGQQVRA